MTLLYLYAITDHPEAPLPHRPGLEDAIPHCVQHQGIAAVVSPVSTREVPATEANLWRHEAVIEALMADRAVLPLRFGTLLAGESAVRHVLTTHYAGFVAALDWVRGRVELGLRVLWEESENPGMADGARRATVGDPLPASGRSYLLARLEEERRRQAWRQTAETLATEIHTALSQLAVEDTQQVLLTPRLLLTAAYLVEQDRVPAFRRQVDALAAGHPALGFLCTGPWPAYSFVTATVPGEIEG